MTEVTARKREEASLAKKACYRQGDKRKRSAAEATARKREEAAAKKRRVTEEATERKRAAASSTINLLFCNVAKMAYTCKLVLTIKNLLSLSFEEFLYKDHPVYLLMDCP